MTLIELEQVMQHLGLLLRDFPMLLGRCHQALDLVAAQYLAVARLLDAEQAKNTATGPIQESVQRPNGQVGQAQRVGYPKGNRFRSADRKRLGDLLTDDDVQ